MAEGAPRMVFLGFGKYVRADRIYALEPLVGDERGGGRRTRVWVEGIAEALIASRTERSILLAMGLTRDEGRSSQVLDDAIGLAERIVQDAERGRVDLGELARRARRVLEATAPTDEGHKLF